MRQTQYSPPATYQPVKEGPYGTPLRFNPYEDSMGLAAKTVRVLREQNLHEEAIQYGVAWLTHPTNMPKKEFLTALGAAYLELAAKDPAQKAACLELAEALAREAVGDSPRDPGSRQFLTRVLEARGKRQEAKKFKRKY